MSPEKLWEISRSLHRSGWPRFARVIKAMNFWLFRCVLPPEAEVGRRLRLEHWGLGVVIHPNVSIGDNVTIFHGVTIAGETWIGSPHRVVIGNDVVLGAHSVILPRSDKGLSIGTSSVVGAGSVLIGDLPANHIAVGVPARIKPRSPSSKVCTEVEHESP